MTRARNISRLVSDQVTGNVNISGILTATTFFGEGSGITGLTAVGVGVTLLDDGTNRGAAQQIDFSDHFSVSTISSGIATITVGVTTEYIDSNQINNAGVVTTSSAIVGSAVTINDSGIDVTGVVTATSFVGNLIGSLSGDATGLSGTPNISLGIVTASQILTNNKFEVSGFTTITNGGIDVIGVVTTSDCTINDALSVAGVANFINPISALNGVDSSGIVTASSFVGDGSQLTGVGNTADVRTSSLVVSGVSTISGDGTNAYLRYGSTNAYTNFVTTYGVSQVGGVSLISADANGAALSADTTLDAAYWRVRTLSDGAEVNGNLTISGPTGGGLSVSGISTFNSDIKIDGNIDAPIGIGTFSSINLNNSAEVIGYSTVTSGGFDSVGVVTSLKGFTSGSSSPVEITVVGSQLIFNVVGIGSTTLTLA